MITIIKTKKNQKHKFTAVILDKNNKLHQIPFGAQSYNDYTITGDKIAKKNYIARHSVREDWDNYLTPGFWARWILWNKKTVNKSIKHVQRKINLPIIYIK